MNLHSFSNCKSELDLQLYKITKMHEIYSYTKIHEILIYTKLELH